MPCYHPMRMVYHGVDNLDPNVKIDARTGELRSLKKIYSFDRLGYHEKDSNNILIPCRKCIGCRLDYSRRWADRLMLELDHSKTAVFLTLTYDDEHLVLGEKTDDLNPLWGTLVKRHVQLFNKRLRFHFPNKEIRFFTSGEYGTKTLRPHYHGIYFGLSIHDFKDLELFSLNNFKQPLYTSKILSDIWSHGFVSIGEVSWQSCAYVARYNLKKLGSGDDGAAASRGVIPEFGLMSRKPGIGGHFITDHPEIFDNPLDKIYISDPYGQRSVNEISMPSYLFQKLELVNPELYDKIKEEKKESSNSRFFDELSKTDLDEFEYLSLKERKHEKSVSCLVRPL